ncbi:MAG: PD-(D/E)XK nuclease superfamily protein [Euryarchaeota archaeon ADurb.Bin023]|jgi:CRISPR/Cas system-associated exonuclease Cas4 (RecB family)|nr:MAG: PD-(D/E)XK nuclease superfamily protein [Euryarchaeota archaeon ADurb.Bin023]
MKPLIKKFRTVDEAVNSYFNNEEDLKRKLRSERITSGNWYSSMMGLCKRAHYFSRQNLPMDMKEDRNNFVTELGNMTHEYISKACYHSGILICSEKTIIDPDTNLKGRFDNLVQLTRGIAMVDIKSQRPEAFFKRTKDKDKVKHHQKVQLASYDYLANKYLPYVYPELVNKKTGKVVDYCIIYYVDRGGGCRDEIPLRFSDSFIKKYVLDELDTLNSYYDRKVIPPSEAWGTWQCKYCGYKKRCTELRIKYKENMKAKDLKSKANNNKKQKNELTNIRNTRQRQTKLF